MTGLKILCLAGLIMTGGSAFADDSVRAGDSDTMMSVPAEVMSIVIEASENVSLTVERSDGKVEILESRGLEVNQGSSVTRDGTVIRVKLQAGPELTGANKSGKTAFVRLAVPSGKNVDISGKSFVLSGMLAASEFNLHGRNVSVHAFKATVSGPVTIDAANSEIKMTLLKAGKLAVTGTELKGRIVVPPSAQLEVPKQTKLRIVRAERVH